MKLVKLIYANPFSQVKQTIVVKDMMQEITKKKKYIYIYI